MPTRYCGAGGNDAWDGLSWATRKLTLNGVENTPVVAGDVVYVAPGVYRELLTCDVSGAAGSPIVYIGDVSGENTDGVGGTVRITGSDDDQTATRANCITAPARSYRTFRGFSFDTTTSHPIDTTGNGGTNWIIEDCKFQNGVAATRLINCAGSAQLNWTIRRCDFLILQSTMYAIYFTHTATVSNCGHVVENCVMSGGAGGVASNRIGGITVRNCQLLIASNGRGVYIVTALAGGQVVTVNNCLIAGNSIGLQAQVLGEIVENYNALYANATARTLVAVGANSNTYPPLFNLGILHAGASQVSGFRFPPPLFGQLSQWSPVRALTDTGAATEDILGLTRPVTAGKRSWGAVQFVDMLRDATTVHAGTASMKFADAGRQQIYVPTTAISTVFSVYVYREANYAGVNPGMIIKQPGQADVVVTDAGGAGAWNQLTTTLTPAALPPYVVVEFVSENTAAAGAYACYFDDLTVT